MMKRRNMLRYPICGIKVTSASLKIKSHVTCMMLLHAFMPIPRMNCVHNIFLFSCIAYAQLKPSPYATSLLPLNLLPCPRARLLDVAPDYSFL
jgi:hypothetical protein